MYKFLLVPCLLLASCSTVALQGTAPCNGRVVITKPTRQFVRHTQNGTLYQVIPKPVCTIPFKKGDRIDEELTFCFLSGSKLGMEIRHEHSVTVNKQHHNHILYDDLIGSADFVPNRTRRIGIDDRTFTIHTTSSAGADECATYRYSANIELMKRTTTPPIK